MNRRRLVVALTAGGLAVAIAVVATRWGAGTSDRSTATPPSGLPARTVEAGAVTVTVEPRRIDASGAEFAVSFDTHSFDLGFDVAGAARLTVAGTAWPSAGWEGDGPGGHHRSGRLRFTSAGRSAGRVEFVLNGLPEPVEATWTLTGG